jgi:hypothetical protein
MHCGLWLVVAGLIVTGTACAHGGGAAATTRTAASQETAVRLNVTNECTFPFEVYVVGSGVEHRLGIVAPGIEGHFVVPRAMIGNGLVEFLAGAARSGQLLLVPGDAVDFVIRSPAFSSTATVRR